MKKRNVIALSIFVVFYISYGIVVALFQERIIYYPTEQSFEACLGFREAEKITYKGTKMYVEHTERPLVVLYHGNAGSACDRAFYKNLFTQAGYGYVIVEYAGYSSDTRKPSHDLVKKDVEHVISYLKENSFNEIVVVGESIGTGAAAYHARLAPPRKLILIAPFTDLAALARKHFWFYPTNWLVDNAFDNVAALSNYNGQVAILHGTVDDIIPYKLGKQLFESIQTDKNLITIEGAGHNDLFLYEETHTSIKKMLDGE